MARCECAKCKIRFTGVSAFDEHLKGGGLVHVHPDGLARLVQRPDGIWGYKPADSGWWQAAQSRPGPQTA